VKYAASTNGVLISGYRNPPNPPNPLPGYPFTLLRQWVSSGSWGLFERVPEVGQEEPVLRLCYEHLPHERLES